MRVLQRSTEDATMLTTQRIRAASARLAAAGGLLLALAPALPAQEGEGGYAYLRTVEGYADHALAEGETFQAAINYPVVPGDRLTLAPGARIEVILPDGSAVRAAEEADLRFVEVAGTLDHDGRITRVELEHGELQVVRPEWSGPEAVELALGGARVVLAAPGSYRVGADGYGSSRVTVREGWAEVSTPRGSRDVRPGETAWVSEGAWTVELARAEARDELEWWGASLDRDVQQAAGSSAVDPQLAYAAAPLAGHGEWVDVSGYRAWRPWVEVGWRPYVSGYWAWTPSGMAWVASEPWGWLTHHYGLWESVPGHGWVWVPGRVYSPAWVYWYWGPTHVAWVPAGYYASVYASWDYQPAWGVYGWVSGGWSHYHDWVFCSIDQFGYGRHHGRFELGREVARRFDDRPVPRGVLATDTRPLTHGGGSGRSTLGDRLAAVRQRVEGERSEDLTSFVARRPEAASKATRLFTRRPDGGPQGGGRDVLGERTATGRATVTPRSWPDRPTAPSASDRDAVLPARPAPPSVDRPGQPSSSDGPSRWNVRPAPPSVDRPGQPSSSDGPSRWNVRPAPPSVDRPGQPSSSDGPSRWNVRPAPPSVRPPSNVRPAPPESYRPPAAEAWRERIQLRPPSGSPAAGAERPRTGSVGGWPTGLDRSAAPSTGGDRAPLVRRVVEGIQEHGRPSSSGNGWSTLRPPVAAAPERPQPERPQSARPPERPQPDRGRQTETRSRDEDPPARSRGKVTSSRDDRR
jgi:hypothetical protein